MFLQFKDNFVRGQNKSDNLICRCYNKVNRDYVILACAAGRGGIDFFSHLIKDRCRFISSISSPLKCESRC